MKSYEIKNILVAIALIFVSILMSSPSHAFSYKDTRAEVLRQIMSGEYSADASPILKEKIEVKKVVEVVEVNKKTDDIDLEDDLDDSSSDPLYKESSINQ